ncbi:MAG: glutathione peroxidase [Planctomycetota bacterium]
MLRPTPALLLTLPLAACGSFFERSAELDPEVSSTSFYALSATDNAGGVRALEEWSGDVALVVNTASECGFTPQYSSLQQVFDEYRDQGFVVLAFPSNEFGGQEPGSNAEIAAFCSGEYGVTFPLFDKVVTQDAAGQSPVYAHLGASTGSLPGWNFGKYLVARDGRVLGFYESRVDPAGAELRGAIEAALAES